MLVPGSGTTEKRNSRSSSEKEQRKVGSATGLHVSYAMSGTALAYAGLQHRRNTDLCDTPTTSLATPCAILGTNLAYGTTRFSEKNSKRLRSTCLRRRYAMSGTYIAYEHSASSDEYERGSGKRGETGKTLLVLNPSNNSILRRRYAMSGTDMCYAATASLVSCCAFAMRCPERVDEAVTSEVVVKYLEPMALCDVWYWHSLWCYDIPSKNIAYGCAMRCPYLRYTCACAMRCPVLACPIAYARVRYQQRVLPMGVVFGWPVLILPTVLLLLVLLGEASTVPRHGMDGERQGRGLDGTARVQRLISPTLSPMLSPMLSTTLLPAPYIACALTYDIAYATAYAKPGTDESYAATRSPRVQSTEEPQMEDNFASLSSATQVQPLLVPTQCPVLKWCTDVWYAARLSGTDVR
eukprot:1298372-Rhodomonas_salina.6